MIVMKSDLQDILTGLASGAGIQPDLHHCARNLTGQRFSRLVALAATTLRQGRSTMWLCECDCGNHTLVSVASLVSGNTKSCGCLRDECHKAMLLPLGEAAFNTLLYDYKQGARARGLAWGLTEDQFRKLTKMNCWYCGAGPSTVRQRARTHGDYIYNGVDRVDNTKGYMPENTVPCCAVCNHAKCNMGYNRFLDWAGAVSSHGAPRETEHGGNS